MSKSLFSILAVTLLLSAGASEAAPSISDYCAKTTAATEQVVCKNPMLLAFSQLPAAMIRLDAMQVSAEAGDLGAQIKLGLVYLFGRGVSQDSVQSLAWFRKAADNGDALGQALVTAMNKDNLAALMNAGMPVPGLNEQNNQRTSGHPVGEELSLSARSDILKQILPFFTLDTDRPESMGMVLEALIGINDDGTLIPPFNNHTPWNPGAIFPDYPELIRLGDTYRRQALESFLVAIRMSQPLKLPPGCKGRKWMRISLSLDHLAKDADRDGSHSILNFGAGTAEQDPPNPSAEPVCNKRP